MTDFKPSDIKLGKCYRIGRSGPLVLMRWDISYDPLVFHVEGYTPSQYRFYEENFLNVVDDGRYLTPAQIHGLQAPPLTYLTFKRIPKFVEEHIDG
jgi:hypothetical protein